METKQKIDMHRGSHGYMRRSLHQGRLQLLWCLHPHRWPSQEEGPWMPPLVMANTSLSSIYLSTSHRLRKNWRCNAAMAYKAWLQGRWIMHPPKQDWIDKSNINSLARHNNLVEWVWTTFPYLLILRIVYHGTKISLTQIHITRPNI